MKSLVQSFLRMAARTLHGLHRPAGSPAATSTPPQPRPPDDVIDYSYGPDSVTGEYSSGEHSQPGLDRYRAPARPGGDDAVR